MAAFTDEARVRLQFQLQDTVAVPDALITQTIADAHDAILARLRTEYTMNPPESVVLGETLLAGSHALLMLASRDAFEQKQVTIGGQRIESGNRFDALLAMAERAEDRGWEVMAPYLVPIPWGPVADVTNREAISGEV